MAKPARTARLTSTRKLLTASWLGHVDSIEATLWRFYDQHPLASDCDVMFFEIAADEMLHVNVTHRCLTKGSGGWAGPGDTPVGFVHNRRFGSATAVPQLARQVREMVFAGLG
jgi:hypothetical protein